MESGYLEVRCLRQTAGKPPHGSTFLPVTATNVATEIRAKDNTSDDALTCLAPGIRMQEYKSGWANVGALAVLWADLDWKSYANGQEGAKAALLAFPYEPHCIVRSGGGYHAYWRLREPWILETNEDRNAATSMLRRLAHKLGADLAPAQVAAVLRAPETWNRKNEPIQAFVSLWEPQRPFLSPPDLDEILPPEADIIEVSKEQKELLKDWAMPPAAIVLDTLRVSKVNRALIEHGPPPKADASDIAQSVISALIRAGYDDGAIRSVFHSTPTGIGAKYFEKRRDGDRWLAHSILKARAWLSSQEKPDVPVESPSWEPEDIVDALSREVPAPAMLIEGLLRHGAISAIVADAGVGKSWLADIIGFHLAAGLPLWGRDVPAPLRVLVVQEEMSDADTLDRLRKIRRTLPVSDVELRRMVFRHVYQTGLVLTDPSRLVEALQADPYDVVFIDTFSATRGGIDENSNNEVGGLLEKLKREICIKMRCHIIFIHHTRKLSGGKDSFDPANMARGAGAFKAVVDNMWVLEKDQTNGWVKLHMAKARGFRAPDKPLLLKIVDTEEGGVEIVMATGDEGKVDVETVSIRVRQYFGRKLADQMQLDVNEGVRGCSEQYSMSISQTLDVFRKLSQETSCTWIVEKGVAFHRGAALELGES